MANFAPPTQPYGQLLDGPGSYPIPGYLDQGIEYSVYTLETAQIAVFGGVGSFGVAATIVSPLVVYCQDFVDSLPVMAQPLLTMGAIQAAGLIAATGALNVTANQQMLATWSRAGTGAITATAGIALPAAWTRAGV